MIILQYLERVDIEKTLNEIMREEKNVKMERENI